MLEALRLTPTDESVYLAALRSRRLSVAEFASVLDLTQSQIARSLETLLAKELLKPDPLDPSRVVPIGPDFLVERLLAEEDARTAQRREALAKARAWLFAIANDYLDTHSTPPAGQLIEQLDDVDKVRLRLEELAPHTTREVLSLHPGPAQSSESLRASRHLDRRALKRGVRMRSVYLAQAAADPPTWNYILEMTSIGAQIRLTSQLPTRLTILDSAIAVIPAEIGAFGGSAMFVRGTGILTAVAALFEQCWNSAEALEIGSAVESARSARQDHQQERDRFILRMMSLGLKDEAIARHLGVSVRTVRRQIADLMARLEANSRFQAGIKAASRGWL